MGYIYVGKFTEAQGYYFISTSNNKIKWSVHSHLFPQAMNLLKEASRSRYVMNELAIENSQLPTIMGTDDIKLIVASRREDIDYEDHSFEILHHRLDAAKNMMERKRRVKSNEALVLAVIALALVSFCSFSAYFGMAGAGVASLSFLTIVRSQFKYSEGNPYKVNFDKDIPEDEILELTTVKMRRPNQVFGLGAMYEGAAELTAQAAATGGRRRPY